MTGGLLAPLSPQEEIALRRIAHGSIVVDAQVASRLIALALIQRTSGGLRLTPLGRLRFNALPKAPLLMPQRSVHAMTGYVEGLIEKAQSRVARQAMSEERPSAPPQQASVLPEAEDDENEPDEPSSCRPVYFFFDFEHWRTRAERNIVRIRRSMMEHRQRQEKLCDDSDRRITASRALLKASAPARPRRLDARDRQHDQRA